MHAHAHRALDSDEILAIYHDQDVVLKSVFDKYCTAFDRAGAPAALGVLLNIAEFRLILKDSGLLGGNNKVGFGLLGRRVGGGIVSDEIGDFLIDLLWCFRYSLLEH